jgi:carbon monoxide dehydrogenase subunit G
MKIEGNFEVDGPIEAVWIHIRDPELVASCMPGCTGVSALSPTLHRATIRVALGPIKTSFNVEIEIIEEIASSEIRSRTRGEEGGRASTVSSENVLRLEALGPVKTNVIYSSEVSVVGRLGRFGLGVMRKKAESMGRDFAVLFGQKVLERMAA